MQIQVNGQPQAVADGSTVADLLKVLDVRSEHVAVELNLQILDRADFTRRKLENGDRVEIISFIGGGTGGERTRRVSFVLAHRAREDGARWTRAVNDPLLILFE